MKPIALHGHMKPVTMVKFNREGDLVFSTSKEPRGVSVWFTSNGERLGVFDGHKSVSGCDVNQTSTLLATAGFDLQTMLWSVETGEALATITQLAPNRSVEFSHGDKLLMAVTDKKMGQQAAIHIYNLPASLGVEPVKTKFNPTQTYTSSDEICFATWGPTNDTIFFSSVDGSVCILDVETNKEVQTAIPHADEVRKIHFDPNYYTLITASKDKSSKLLDSRNLKVVQTYQNDMPVNDAAISPTGDHVIIGGGTEAQDVTTTGGQSKFEVKFHHKVFGDHLGSMRCHFGTINTLAWHPSGSGFCSGAVDGFVKLNTFEESYFSSPGATAMWAKPEVADE